MRPEPSWTAERAERLLDQMRLWGLGDDLVAEADARLHADIEAGWRWLAERLAELNPAEAGPTCFYCSTALVEPGQIGELRAACPGCGAVWEVEMHPPGEWARREVQGPSAEWLAAHPANTDDEIDPADVLDGDLPPLPDRIEPGESHPVAQWHDDQYGAVLYVTREKLRPGDFPGDEYGHEIEHCQRDQSGSWIEIGGGGGGWVNSLTVPPDLMEKYGLIGTNVSGPRMGDDVVNFTGGVVRPGISLAEVHDSKGTCRYPIDQQTRIFLVGAYGPRSSVHLLDEEGRPARGHNGTPIIIDMS